MLHSAKHLKACSGTALTEVSPSWRHHSKDTLWGANTPWRNRGSNRWLQLLSMEAALFHELQTWRETSSLENEALCFAKCLHASVSPAVKVRPTLAAQNTSMGCNERCYQEETGIKLAHWSLFLGISIAVTWWRMVSQGMAQPRTIQE